MSEPPITELGAEAAADGRPSSGQALAQTLDEAAARRPKSRNVRALGHLIPFAAGHRADALAAALFLVVASAATLSMTGAVRLLVDKVNTARAVHAGVSTVAPWFWALGGVEVLGGAPDVDNTASQARADVHARVRRARAVSRPRPPGTVDGRLRGGREHVRVSRRVRAAGR